MVRGTGKTTPARLAGRASPPATQLAAIYGTLAVPAGFPFTPEQPCKRGYQEPRFTDGEMGQWGEVCLIQGHNDKVAGQGWARLPKGGLRGQQEPSVL